MTMTMIFVDEDEEMEGNHVGEDYVPMASPTTAISNPEYFSDDLTTSQIAPRQRPDVSSPRQQSSDNYYNHPPPPKPVMSPPSAAVKRQTSQV